MSRSASDATRFTATGPHAYSKPFRKPGADAATTAPGPNPQPSPSSSQPQQPQSSSNAGRQETPKEKVERLRAEARAERIRRSSSLSDRVMQRGRLWADRAHRFVVLTLIATSGIAGVVTIYTVGSFMMHTQRQRALFVQREIQSLTEAKKAYVAGTASPEQMELLRKEKAADEAKQAKEELKKQGTLYKAREWIFGGLKKDEEIPDLSNDTANQKSGILEMVNATRDGSRTNTEPAAPVQTLPEQQGEAGKEGSSWSKWSNWVMGR